MSFLYDVESSSGNTGRGLIVVKVVRESVPNYPVVDDTVLTAETRDDFPSGVDVLTDRRHWSGGDVGDLEVALWGDPPGVDGRRPRPCAASCPQTTQVIPFAVTGEGADGRGHDLRVPARARRRRSLAGAAVASAAPPEVTELESVSFDMTALVAKPRGSTPRGRRRRARVGRPQRRLVHGRIRHRPSATTRAPGRPGWMRARFRSGSPGRTTGPTSRCRSSCARSIPQPELRAGSMTVGPGETATFDLRNMTSWQLREDWSGIRYALDYSGSAFEVSLDGSTVTVVGADRAVPGSEEAASSRSRATPRSRRCG